MSFLLCVLCDLGVRHRLGLFLPILFLATGAQIETNNQATSNFKGEVPKALTGTIYSQDRKTVLFEFTRRITRSGLKLETVREYSYPDQRGGASVLPRAGGTASRPSDGKLAARERVVYDGNDFQFYELEELQTGGHGRATVKPDPQDPKKQLLYFEYSNDLASRAKPKVGSETLQKDTLNNNMVGPFLSSHWDALIQGQEVKCRFIVVPRRETIGFRFVKESESQWHGKPIVILKMEPTSPVIRALVDPLHFKVEKEGAHRVLEYSGRTTPKKKSGNKWEALDALTIFDW